MELETGLVQDLLTGFEGEETDGAAISGRMALGCRIPVQVDSITIEGDPAAHDDPVVLDGGWQCRLRHSGCVVRGSSELS